MNSVENEAVEFIALFFEKFFGTIESDTIKESGGESFPVERMSKV